MWDTLGVSGFFQVLYSLQMSKEKDVPEELESENNFNGLWFLEALLFKSI